VTWVNTSFIFARPLAIIAALFILACQHKPRTIEKDQPGEKAKPTSLYKKPASGFSDTLLIKGSVAVFFTPDSVQLGKIKAVMGKMQYESDVHDCFFQAKNARSVISAYWPGVKIVEARNCRFILFVNNNGTAQLLDLDMKNDMCGLFLFNGIKDPVQADMTNIDTFLEQYFRD
jgi:hypothetical protein